jgi:hypothetical protein
MDVSVCSWWEKDIFSYHSVFFVVRLSFEESFIYGGNTNKVLFKSIPGDDLKLFFD